MRNPHIAKRFAGKSIPGHIAAEQEKKAGAKKRRFRPGTCALRAIKKYQKTTDFCLRKAPFQRLVREVAQDYKSDLRFTSSAVLALQEAAEDHMIRLFGNAQAMVLKVAAKRITVRGDDLKAVRYITERQFV